MDLTRTRVVLRERAVLDVLDLALRFVVDHARIYARASLVVLTPFIVASALLAHFAGWVTVWGFTLFAATFAAAPFTVLASRLVFEDEVRVRAAVGSAAARLPAIFLLRGLTFVGSAIGLWLFLLPGLWLLAITVFVGEVLMLERATSRLALTRSARIVGRESGEAIVGLSLLVLLHLVAVFAADMGGRTFIGALLESRAPDPIWASGGSVLALLGFWLFVPYAATARFFLYLDVRTRSEGWDIQTRFVALAARGSAEAIDVRGAA